MKKLTDLPNIGPTLAKKLIAVSIKTPADLRRVGSTKAFAKIKSMDSSACYNMLYALEGAVQGIRWHNLAKKERNNLKDKIKNL